MGWKALAQQNIEQQAQKYYNRAERYFLAEEPTEETDQLARKDYLTVIQLHEDADVNSHLLGDSYRRLGSIALGSQNFDEAKAGYHQALSLKKSLPQGIDSLIYMELIMLGDTHFLTDRPDSAEWYYERAEKIAVRFPMVSDVERIYNSFGAFHYRTGNYSQAINYYKKALSLVREDNPDFLEAKVSFTYNIANAQLKMSRYQGALQSYRQLLDYGIYSEFIYLNMGLAYLRSQSYDSARLYLNKTKDSSQPRLRISSLNGLGHLALETGRQDTALSLFEKAIMDNKNSYARKNLLLIKSFLGQAKAYAETGKFEEARNQYQYAIQYNSLASDQDAASEGDRDMFRVISLQDLFNAYNGLGEIMLAKYHQTNEQAFLQQAIYKYDTAISVARHIQKTYNNDEAKLFLVQKVYPVYEKAIAASHQLYRSTGDQQYVLLAFQLSEKSKAAVLSEMLDELKIRSTVQVSDSLIGEEKKWKQQITQTRIRLTESQDSAQVSRLQTALIDQEIGLSRTIRALQDDEKYFHLKYREENLNIGQFQSKLLEGDHALLEYFLGSDSLYSFLITRDKFLMKSAVLDTSFEEALNQIKSSLYDYSTGDDYQNQSKAFQLYQVLIKPYEDEIRNKKKLTIIPDGALNYIPFEMLTNSGKNGHYLLEDYTFSYAYSAALLQDAVRNRRAKETGTILAMAPFTGNEEGNIRSNGFKMLFSSKEEVERVGGSIYTENKATKRLFLELASSYGIVHLATHASISSEDPLESFIAFYPDQDSSNVGYRLYTHELYNMQLDSVKLVVLSACEAGNGKLVRGEGIISLARAFAYAGCPNIVTTLWKAQDKSTAAIASGLHEYLRKGYAKDEALRQAKLDYLKSKDVHPMLKTPYHWANFIFIGDPAPIYEAGINFWWYIIPFLVFLILFILLKQGVFKTKQP